MKTLANISSFESLMNNKPVQVNNWFGFGSQAPQKWDFSNQEMWAAYDAERKRRMFSRKVSALVGPTNRLLATARQLQGLIFTVTQGGGSINQYGNMEKLKKAWVKQWGEFRKAALDTQNTSREVFKITAQPKAAAQGAAQGVAANPQAQNNGTFTVGAGSATPAPAAQQQTAGPDYGTTYTATASTPTDPSSTTKIPRNQKTGFSVAGQKQSRKHYTETPATQSPYTYMGGNVNI